MCLAWLALCIISAFGQGKVPASAKRAIIDKMVQDSEVTREQLREGTLEITTIHLNRDRQPEYRVDGSGGGFCMRSCSVWIYRKNGDRYEKIFGGEMREVSVLKSYTNGYRNLSVAGFSGPCLIISHTHRFTNGKYQEQPNSCEEHDACTNKSTRCNH